MITAYFNIYDLVDAGAAGERVISFDTEDDLLQYTNSTAQWFDFGVQPLSNLLSFLLEHIIVEEDTESDTRPGGPYLGDFFAEYPGFDFDPSQPVMMEFYRMCDFFEWDRDDERKNAARQGVQDAIALTFNELYGTDLDDLNSWQALCRAVYIDSIPDDVQKCRKVSSGSFESHTQHRYLALISS